MKNGNISPIIVSSCIYLEDESSEMQVKSIKTEIEKMNRSLARWREVTEREFPGDSYLLDCIPKQGSAHLGKIGKNSAITSDTCNSARKARRVLVEFVLNIGGTLHDIDCVQHLRNIWLRLTPSYTGLP